MSRKRKVFLTSIFHDTYANGNVMIKHTCCIVNVMEKWISLFYFILQNAAIAMFGHISKKSPAHELKLKV